MKKRIAALLCVIAVGVGGVVPAASYGQVKAGPAPTQQQKKVQKLTEQIRKLNQKVRMLRADRDRLQEVVAADVATQVGALSADALWPIVANIGIRLADFPGYHAEVREKIDDAGTYETFCYTQANYFQVLELG